MLEQETMKTRQMGPSGCNIDGCLNYLYRPQKRGKKQSAAERSAKMFAQKSMSAGEFCKNL